MVTAHPNITDLIKDNKKKNYNFCI